MKTQMTCTNSGIGRGRSRGAGGQVGVGQTEG